jgi:hypothetical protein
MNEMTLDQNDQEFFTYEISDEALEVAASSGKANTFTQWMCTAVFFLPWSLNQQYPNVSLNLRPVTYPPALRAFSCPLLKVKRTWPIAVQMSAFDPKRTLTTFLTVASKSVRL